MPELDLRSALLSALHTTVAVEYSCHYREQKLLHNKVTFHTGC